MMHGRSDPTDYGPSAVPGWSVTRDETICTSDFTGLRRDKWGGQEVGIDGTPDGPSGTCCNNGGACSTAAANTNRWVLPKSGSGEAAAIGAASGDTYTMRYFLPSGVTCDRCVLQMTYVTGNSNDKYPETFWNCVRFYELRALAMASVCSPFLNIPFGFLSAFPSATFSYYRSRC